ncbi:1730_t:CDS:2, partial [Funneliformis geosporum]
EPLDIARISTALFVRVEKEDIERVKKLRSFGTEKKLAKWYVITTSEEVDVRYVLDIKLELFTDIPGSVCDIFKEPFKNIS